MRAVHAPRESLRMYLKKHIPTPIPSGDKNILNKRHRSLTLLHESVIFLKHDITDLLIEHGANVNIVTGILVGLHSITLFWPISGEVTRSWLNELTSTDSVKRLHCRPLSNTNRKDDSAHHQ